MLPANAELAEIALGLLAPNKLPELWPADEIAVQDAINYFDGAKIVQVDRGDYQEPVSVPKASPKVVESAVAGAVESGTVWLLSGPASILGEPIPAGVLTPGAKLRAPPTMIAAAEVLPENLPGAWQGEETNALAIATALSQKAGKTLPWKTVKDAITASLQARFTELVEGDGAWPCEVHAAKSVRLTVAAGGGDDGGGRGRGGRMPPQVRVAAADFEPSQIQDLADVIPALLEIKARANVAMKFHVCLELGDGKTRPSDEVVGEVNSALQDLDDGFRAT